MKLRRKSSISSLRKRQQEFLNLRRLADVLCCRCSQFVLGPSSARLHEAPCSWQLLFCNLLAVDSLDVLHPRNSSVSKKKKPSETVHEMDVEQAQEQPLTGGASSSSGPVAPVQEAVPMASPSSHEVRMVETSRPNTRHLEEVVDGGESSNKRARSLAGMLLFVEMTLQTGRTQSGRRN